ncbi:1,4-dihydroxy-2-naphthoyl-CoA synthase [Paraburkholderia domus]|jgi:Enoyl-CoA hydratase/carnithine racemase|uniref:1,4-dihydroxy-2-naphthoyl-CoA synthase n=1 Tax=Paraburkholderia domus TaxID=2793075 RepID=A0A9N8R0U1_9BURK|nr:enoyl-CoA hydratase/isomerase family protein [Paraburkholderia domus]MBK5048527.1 enoyl-CoA hydratase/isomerase family protein [Burkholderia sp. R-70006]MBK5060884.1 enoyl-CoA hydratase/isomerase family protein [Burkholderia sp. R-70199]MBK5085896.1 enoyl-CoA hydratase/isomerase family protein [Burkholderia sp. R-69927]MBK5120520.1 enoyl-CoA hydratase/isomerase family protein [Burkholderia sp. R-69980]MBK5166083.1 enoyl-CoA hydratase/isomerase family protein [Burkholderia sp. R-70211]MBK51
MEPAILVEKDGPVARLILNRPEKHNALKFDDLDTLVEALHEAEADDDIKVIILKGRGQSFCSGHDYNDAVRSYGLEVTEPGVKPRRPSQRSRLLRDRKLGENYMAFQYSLKPVIAQVQGWCTGAGLYLVELVDLAISADDARFSHSEQRLGLAGNTWHLNTQIMTYGPKKARELLLLGDNFDGRDAERLGLVNQSVPQEQLESTVEDWARRVAQHPRDALVTGKAMFQMALDSLGGSQQFYRGYVGHTLGTNLRLEEDEYNFLRERRDKGTTAAFKERNKVFD